MVTQSFRFVRRGLDSGTWRRGRESVREDCCWLRRFFGIVRLDSVKFGRFGLPEWDVLTSGDVVTVLIPSV